MAGTGFAEDSTNSFYDLKAVSIDGQAAPLSDYKGKVLLLVNTASKCGFTSQYEGLEKLYLTLKEQGLEILAFPSNDFADQEPGTNGEIKEFCKTKFGVTFPLFAKDHVKGKGKQLVYKYLTEQIAEEFRGEVSWNFEKFLVDKKGVVRARYTSLRGPSSAKLKAKIEELLKEDS